jgi:amino acid adenylation domain-containing protein
MNLRSLLNPQFLDPNPVINRQIVNNCSLPKSAATPIDFDPFIDGEILLTAPATESQQEIWIGAQMSHEANLAYVLSQSLRLKGRVNLNALQIAIDRLMLHHEALRTTFSGDGTRLLIAKTIEFESSVVDLSTLSIQSRLAEIDRHQQQAVNEGFDLQHGPLFRTKIIKVDDEEHLVILTVHHIICDGWSYGVLFADLAKIYSALNREVTPELGEPEYLSEYAVEEQAKSGSLATIATAKYWLEKFANLPPVIDLPIDYHRPAIATFNTEREDLVLNTSLVNDLKQLGIEHGCSLMTLLLVAFEIFLYKLSGATEFVVGVPTSGQMTSGRYNLVGHCVNFLPLRSNIDPESKFSEYLRARSSEILDDYDRQDFTFGSLLKKLAIPRNASRIPLISAIFNIDLDSGGDRLGFDGLASEIMPNPNAFGTFEFGFNGSTTSAGEIKLDCQYNANLFKRETIRRRLEEFERLLTDTIAKSDAPIHRLSLLSSSAEHQLLVAWNHTQTNYPKSQSIPQLFTEQVERDGDAIALVFEDRQITYRELDRQANRLANYLLGLGIRSGQLIGIAIERSIETIVSILAILKAGYAYLPLDLSYPSERLSFMLENSQVSILLTKQAAIAKLPPHQVQTICIDTDWDKISQAESSNPQLPVQPDDLAYVMYTSGSTGQPKGVCITHRGVVRLVKTTNYIDFSPQQVFLHLAPLAFDASTFEIWGSLLNGAKLVLFPGDKPSLAELGQTIRQQQITTIWLTAGLFHLMVDERIEDLHSVRQLLAGGDALSAPHVRKVLSTLTNCQLINGYGPTENTTFTCCHLISQTDPLLTSVPIGRPIANTQVYILDRDLQPVPIGITGELHTGGDGLAQGYLHSPDLTAARFIPNPFGVGKIYKTGDLARYLPDGTIEFLGRSDNQVKIRGFRIELGEIETVLSQHPDLRAVTVIDLQDRSGEKRLVAYLIPQLHKQPTPEQLRTFLQSKLPDYMIPSAFVMLDALPLTPNGKVDRHALPAPEYIIRSESSSGTLVAPRNELERQLTEIWERVLDVRPIGIRDNFFALGGHSLLAVRLFVEIEQILGRNLPLATLFQHQTIEELAMMLDDAAYSAPWSPLVLIQPGGSKPPLFCIHPIGGNILEYQALATYLGTEQPIYGLQSRGLDGQQPVLVTVEDMASHYIAEIRTIQAQGPYFILGYSFGGAIAFEMARQLDLKGEKTALLALLDCNASNLPNLRPSPIGSIGIHLHNLWKLEAQERLSYIMGRVAYRLSGGTDRDFLAKSLYDPKDLTPQLLTVLDANLQASQDYTTQFYPGKVTLFRCDIQDLEYCLHPNLGWKNMADRVEIRSVPGPHFTMLKEPRVRVFAEEFKSCLQLAQAELDLQL